ncbi:DNA polymerase epsilon subunit 4 [Acrasis kona]|uniref:Chromatin accessibility complex protein 1 n=1 Tax=Acrasis kona TaxID=1008807 RepID=A0AAW2ZDR5_9EUKA
MEPNEHAEEQSDVIIGDADATNKEQKDGEDGVKTYADLPLARVKRIMKSDADVKLISQEAVILVAKAAECLIEHLASEAFKHTQSDNRKTLQYKDLSATVKSSEVFDFLEEIIPERTQFATALSKQNK